MVNDRRTLVVGTTEESLFRIFADDISGSSYGADQRIRISVVNLAAEAIDVNIDDICLGIVSAIPDVLKDHRASQDVAFVAREVLQHGIFLRRQVNSPSRTFHSSCSRVNFQIAN